MRSINLKWLNLTLSNQPDSASSEYFLQTPKIKRLENQDFEQNKNRQFLTKMSVSKISNENFCDFRPITADFWLSLLPPTRVEMILLDLASLNMPNQNLKIGKR